MMFINPQFCKKCQRQVDLVSTVYDRDNALKVFYQCGFCKKVFIKEMVSKDKKKKEEECVE